MAARLRATVRYPVTAAAAEPPTVSVRKHNAILDAAQDRVDKLEPRLAAVIETILHKAGARAASLFEERVTRHPVPDATLNAAAANADVAKTSTMIALKPRPAEAAALADPDGDPPEILHVTLAFLGDSDQPLSEIADVLKPVAAMYGPLSGVVGGLGVFHPAGVGIALPDVRGLTETRQAVVQALSDADIDYGRDHGFTPHITIQSDGEPPDDSLAGQPLHFDSLHIVRGNDEEIELPLVGVRALTAAGPDWSPPFANELIDVDALIKQILEKTEPVRAALIEQTMTPALEQAGIKFDVSNPLTAKLFADTGSQVTNIAMTTRANLMDIISKSYTNGLTIPATRDLIRTGMREASKTRATMIARTEMARAVNGGSLAATQLVSEVTGQGYDKVWHTAPGARYPRHELYDGLDGQTVGMDEAFQVGDDELQYPGDPNGEPGETINCRCTLSYQEVQEAGHPAAPEEPSPLPDTSVSNPLTPLTSDDPELLAATLHDRAEAVEPALTKAMKDLARLEGGELAGLAFRLKSEASTVSKIKADAIEKNIAAHDAASAIADEVRYTVLFDPADYVTKSRALLDDLKSRGYAIRRFRNTWASGGNYKGINVQVATPNGYRWELQFHTDESFKLKNEVIHKPYEEWRKIADKSSPRAVELDQQMRALTAEVPNPPGVAQFTYDINAPVPLVTPPVPAEVAPTPLAAPISQSIDIGITPFRAGEDNAVGFYDSAKFQKFIEDVNQSAAAYGEHIDGIDKVTGVWEGDTEPSVSIHVSPTEPKPEDDTYKIQHRAPTDDGHNAPIWDLTQHDLYPPDIYSDKIQVAYQPNVVPASKIYGSGPALEDADKAAFNIIDGVHGDPSAMVTIYRAVPENVNEINPGDWVTPVKSYAEANGDSNLGQDLKSHVISMQVPASQVFTDANSILEWGWSPPNLEQFNAETRARAFAANLGKAYNQDGVLLFSPPTSPPAWVMPPVIAGEGVSAADVAKATDTVRAALDRLSAAGVSPTFDLGISKTPFQGIGKVSVEHLGKDKAGALASGDDITINVDNPDWAEGANAAGYVRDAKSIAAGETPLNNQVDPADLVIHEVGHVVYQSLDQVQRDEWQALWDRLGKEDISVSNLPSFYAQEAKADAWAETFVSVVRNRGLGPEWQALQRKLLTDSGVLPSKGNDLMVTFRESLPERRVMDAMSKAGISGGRFTTDGRLQIIGSGADFVKQVQALSKELGGIDFEVGNPTNLWVAMHDFTGPGSSYFKDVVDLTRHIDSPDQIRLVFQGMPTEVSEALKLPVGEVTDHEQMQLQQAFIQSSAKSLEDRGLADTVTVYGSEKPAPGEIQSFFLKPGDGLQPYTISRSDILVDMDAYAPTPTTRAEMLHPERVSTSRVETNEVLVRGEALKPGAVPVATNPGAYDAARGKFDLMDRDSGDYQKALDAFSRPKGVTATDVPVKNPPPQTETTKGEDIPGYARRQEIQPTVDALVNRPDTKAWIENVYNENYDALGIPDTGLGFAPAVSIRNYTEDGSSDINAMLAGHPKELYELSQYDNNEAVKIEADHMAEIVKSAPPLPDGTTLYRGINPIGVDPSLKEAGDKIVEENTTAMIAKVFGDVPPDSPAGREIIGTKKEKAAQRALVAKNKKDLVNLTANWAKQRYPVGSYVAMGEPGEFESMTLNPALAANFQGQGENNVVFRILNAKTGAPLFPFSSLPDEYEVLAPPRTFYRVRSVEIHKMQRALLEPKDAGKLTDRVVVNVEEVPTCSKAYPLTSAGGVTAYRLPCTDDAQYTPKGDRPPVTVGNGTLFPGQPRDVAVSAAAYRDGKIAEYAAANNMSVADYKSAAQEAIRSYIAQHPQIRIRASHQALESILRTGQYLSEFANKDIPADWLAERAGVEKNLFGYGTDTAPADRPVYGYLAGTADETGEVQEYGDIILNLDPSVNARSTFTIGDSYRAGRAGHLSPSLLADPGIGSWDGSFDIVKAYRSGDLGQISRYVEVEIHGGLPSSDIGGINADQALMVSREDAVRLRESIEAATEVYANNRGTQTESPQVEQSGLPADKPQQFDYATALHELGKEAGLRQGALADLIARVGLKGVVADDFEDFNILGDIGSGVI